MIVAPKNAVPRAGVYGVPESSDTVTLWKAPGPGRTGVADEVTKGYDPKVYPGDGPYFATDKELALDWQSRYKNGLQEIQIPRSTFDELVQKGVIQRDTHYDYMYPKDKGGSWNVPSDKLVEFNKVINNLKNNRYYPQ